MIATTAATASGRRLGGQGPGRLWRRWRVEDLIVEHLHGRQRRRDPLEGERADVTEPKRPARTHQRPYHRVGEGLTRLRRGLEPGRLNDRHPGEVAAVLGDLTRADTDAQLRRT